MLWKIKRPTVISRPFYFLNQGACVILKLLHTILGDLEASEIKKVLYLTLIFLLITGTYAILHPLKEALFVRIVGKLYIPYAKMASFIILVPILFIYAKLVDLLEKHQLFYLLCSIFAVSFLVIAYALTLPVIGLSNTTLDASRLLGWFIYLVTESFSSLMFTLFWSFVVSITDLKSAKYGYPFIVAGSQIGAISGPELVKHATYIGVPQLFTIVSLTTLAIIFVIRKFTTSTQTKALPAKTGRMSTGTLEGLRLLLSKPYLIGIFAVSTINEVINSILEYHLVIRADESFVSTENVVEFFGHYIQSTTILTFVFSLIGTSFLIQFFGITFSLMLYPILSAIIIIAVMLKPTLSVIFVALVIFKGLSYALNLPCKEMLYLQTSTDIKFKTKSWIDGFGRRLTKTVGSSINAAFAPTAHVILYSSLASLGIIGLWLMVALYVGTTNDRLVRNDTLIE